MSIVVRRDRVLLKYSRYNASQKGRERVERYRCTAKGILARWRAELNQRIGQHGEQVAALRVQQ